ncbi:hypothetical protein [Hyphomicrobium sp.]|uniref:hypothetical protein n=1 Tax=Hyphomicrobium sp. TaxID=82 RepID=UPI002E2F5A91|nr:hypothetical protein [Hyphomicrobium sp.]HEX2842755.1 hypothetical protein [Hyphomicrobium sp.]
MTPLDNERLEKIRANAAFAIEEFREAAEKQIGYDADSVAWVEGFVERARERYAESGVPSGLVSVIGSYLGEAIIAETGGQWTQDDEGRLAIQFPNQDAVYPFAKVEKQFDQGVAGGESILSFYTVSLSYIAIGALRETT